MPIENTFILAYQDSDEDLFGICQEFKKRENLTDTLKAVIALRESLAVNGNKEHAQSLAEQTKPKAETNKNLIVLKKALQANVAYALKNYTESQIHLKEGKSYLTELTLPEIKAYIDWIEIVIDIYDLSNRKFKINAFFDNLILTSPRANPYRLNQIISKVYLGISKNDLMLLMQQSHSKQFKSSVERFLFIDAIENGDLESAAQHYQVFSKMKFYFIEDDTINTTFEKYALLFDFYLKATSNDSPNFAPIGFQAKSIERMGSHNYPTWLLTIKSLLEKNSHEALHWARMEQRGQYQHRNSGFFLLNALRAELSNRNIETADSELNKVATSLSGSPTLPLFKARLALLKNNQSEANNYLSELGTSLETHNAWGRLNLELLLSNELKPMDIFNMGRAISKNNLTITQTSSAPKEPKPFMQLKFLDKIIGNSINIKNLKAQIDKVKDLDLTVLITGETGTGKELIAECIHECSNRKNQPFLKINCAAVSESLLESELFGHEKGAFTGAHSDRKGLFEEAGNGTIFLDEIGEISPKIQTALLRVLESNEIKPLGSNLTKKTTCRVITATNANLSELSKQNKFRQDLYFRLHRLPIESPALRDRKEDILLLAQHFAQNSSPDRNPPAFSSDLKEVLLNYSWPGNIRELKNEIERLVLMNLQKRTLSVADLDLNIQLSPQNQKTTHFNINPVEEVQTKPNFSQNEHTATSFSFSSSLRRIEFIKQLFTNKINLTRIEIASATGVSTFTTTRDLKQLINEGFIEKIQPTPAPRTHYFKLKP